MSNPHNPVTIVTGGGNLVTAVTDGGNPVTAVTDGGNLVTLTTSGMNPVTFIGGGFTPLYTLLDAVGDAFRGDTNTLLGGGSNTKFTLSFMARPDSFPFNNHNIINSGFFKVRIKSQDGGVTYNIALRCTGTDTAVCRPFSSVTLVATTLYHFHIAVDYSTGTDVTIHINGVNDAAIGDEVARVTGTFTFADGIYGFGGSSDDPPGANGLFHGCLGQLYFIQGVAETDSSKFYDTGTSLPYDWRTHTPVTDLGTPDLLVMDWLDLSGSDIVSDGDTGNVVNGANGGAATYGDPTRCS